MKRTNSDVFYLFNNVHSLKIYNFKESINLRKCSHNQITILWFFSFPSLVLRTISDYIKWIQSLDKFIAELQEKECLKVFGSDINQVFIDAQKSLREALLMSDQSKIEFIKYVIHNKCEEFKDMAVDFVSRVELSEDEKLEYQSALSELFSVDEEGSQSTQPYEDVIDENDADKENTSEMIEPNPGIGLKRTTSYSSGLFKFLDEKMTYEESNENGALELKKG